MKTYIINFSGYTYVEAENEKDAIENFSSVDLNEAYITTDYVEKFDEDEEDE